jgi:glutaminyl-tRNA synthetase
VTTTSKPPPSDRRPDATPAPERNDFIRDIIREDLRTGKHGGRVATRFPPEPNGYLHIGHAKSICLNFGIAEEFHARCNLRFDDTNPTKEDVEYVEAIQRDVRWLGFDFGEKALYASDYFQQMYDYAVQLIKDGKAYVCSLSEEEIRQYRGTLTQPGRESPYRNRSVEENLDLFARMAAGEFPDGTHVLRAKIDMAASNMKMRDPLLYRIRRVPHDRTGDRWKIYPMYDYAHPISDALEHITHSICTLEFENNRELYDWVIANTPVPSRPQQIEFARLNLDYTVMSKRKLLQLVEEKVVHGWDDPRMPTIAGMRRRGYTPEAIRAFAELIGVSKHNSTVDIGKLEFCVRNDLNHRAPRVMAVLRPLKVTLTNYPEGSSEEFEAPYFPPDVGKEGSRPVPFARELFLEREDFSEEPPRDYLRLAPGRVVRLRHAYCIRCDEVVKDPATGEVVELRCTYVPETRGGQNPQGEKVWGVLHWVSARHGVRAEVRLYDRLFTVPRPDADESVDFKQYLNPDSLRVLQDAVVEPSVASAEPGARFQFERQGYFAVDSVDSKPGALVFNRIVTLRDGWAARAAGEHATPSAPPSEPGAGKSPKAKTRPPKRSKAEIRADAREADPTLAARMARYQSEFGLSSEEADLLTGDAATAALFEAALAAYPKAESVARWIINELPRELGDRDVASVPFTGAQLGKLVALVDAGTVTGPAAKDVFAHMMREGGDPAAIIEQRGLGQLSDASAIEAIVARVLADNADKVAQYKSGKTGLLGFFVGQVVKESKGRANPQVARELLEKKLA